MKKVLCDRCKVVMKSGATYEQRNGREFFRGFNECPKCHDRNYNNNLNFYETLVETAKRYYYK